MWGQSDIQKLVPMLAYLGIPTSAVPAHAVVLGGGTSVTPGATGTLFASNGAGADPSYQTLAALGIAPLPLPANSVGSSQIAAGAVGTSQLASGAVTTAKIANQAVGTAQIANLAVGAAQLANGVTALGIVTQAASGHFFSNLGSNINRFNDRLFLGTATQNDGKQSPTTTDWTGSIYIVAGASAYGYLETNATLSVGGPFGQIGSTFATRTSDSPTPGTAAIGVASLTINDDTRSSGGDSWAFYGTTARGVGATGFSTLGMELDVANLGASVPIYPGHLFNSGLTANLWIAAGGELSNQAGGAYTFANTSAAMVIFANNGAAYANVAYDKGIVFGSNAFNANNCAIAFYTGHQMKWFNSSDQVVGAITQAATTVATGQQIFLSAFGLQITDMSGNPQFSVANNISGAANFLTTTASVAGGPPVISANGTDTNIDIQLFPKGTGAVLLGAYTAGAIVQNGYITVKDSGGVVRRLLAG